VLVLLRSKQAIGKVLVCLKEERTQSLSRAWLGADMSIRLLCIGMKKMLGERWLIVG